MKRALGALLLSVCGVVHAELILEISDDTSTTTYPFTQLEGASIAPVLALENGFRLKVLGAPEAARIQYRTVSVLHRINDNERYEPVPATEDEPGASAWFDVPSEFPLKVDDVSVTPGEVRAAILDSLPPGQPADDRLEEMVLPYQLQIRVVPPQGTETLITLPIFLGC